MAGRPSADPGPTRPLYDGDHLPFLREMAAGSVDPVHLDPPFNSHRACNSIHPGDLEPVTAFEDLAP